MPRTKKAPVYQYGIEITKSHSHEMYDHNDMVAEEMKTNILDKWNRLIKGTDKDMDWTSIEMFMTSSTTYCCEDVTYITWM